MHFEFDRGSRLGVDASGAYAVAVENDRYGTVFRLCVSDNNTWEIWARRTERPPNEGEIRSGSFANVQELIVWIVDNRAGTGVPLLTLEDGVGDYSLGEVLHAFLSSYETALDGEWNPASKPLKVECRGNQRFGIEERYGP